MRSKGFLFEHERIYLQGTHPCVIDSACIVMVNHRSTNIACNSLLVQVYACVQDLPFAAGAGRALRRGSAHSFRGVAGHGAGGLARLYAADLLDGRASRSGRGAGSGRR